VISDRWDVDPALPVLQSRGGRNDSSTEARAYLDGDAGTIFVQKPGEANGELVISSFDERHATSLHLTRSTSLSGILSFDSIAIGCLRRSAPDSERARRDAADLGNVARHRGNARSRTRPGHRQLPSRRGRTSPQAMATAPRSARWNRSSGRELTTHDEGEHHDHHCQSSPSRRLRPVRAAVVRPPLPVADGRGDDAHPHPSAPPPAEAVIHSSRAGARASGLRLWEMLVIKITRAFLA
jgi:hypothetical protein